MPYSTVIMLILVGYLRNLCSYNVHGYFTDTWEMLDSPKSSDYYQPNPHKKRKKGMSGAQCLGHIVSDIPVYI